MVKIKSNKNNNYSEHDKFFKLNMQNLSVAKGFLLQYLPDVLLNKEIAWETLAIEPTHFLSDIFSEQIVDVLYRVKINGEDHFLLILVEHQSAPDELMPWRLLSYFVSIVQHKLSNYVQKSKKKKLLKKLPVVYPIIFYTGLKPYKFSTKVSDLFSDPQLTEFIWTNPIQLIELQNISDQELSLANLAHVFQLVMKKIHSKDLLQYLVKFKKSFQIFSDKQFRRYFRGTLWYIFNKSQVENIDEILNFFSQSVEHNTRGEAMSLYNAIIKRGLKEGIEQGLVRGIEQGIEQGREEGRFLERLTMIKSLLKNNIEPEKIAGLINVSLEDVLSIKRQVEFNEN